MLYTSALFALLPAALAAVHRVDVGLGGLKFSPDSLTAAPGDILEFHYHPKNHSVQQSSFAAPCKPLAGGFDSGFNPVTAEQTEAQISHFSVVVNNTKPIWIYCAQGIHCKSGMSMVVNQPAPPSPNTLQAYQLAAQSVDSVAGPLAPVGGIFSNGTSNSTSSTSSVALTTYTSVYSTYTTSSAGVATTVSLAQTVTALSSTSAATSATTATSSTAVATGNAAAGPLDIGSWAVAAGVAVVGGLVF